MNREQRRKLAKANRRRGMGFTRRFSSSRARNKFQKLNVVRTKWPLVDPDATTEEYPDLTNDLIPAELVEDLPEILVDYDPTLIVDPDEETSEILKRLETIDLLDPS